MKQSKDLEHALKIISGVCPNCGHTKTMHDGLGLLWCPACDESYDETEFVFDNAELLLGLTIKAFELQTKTVEES